MRSRNDDTSDIASINEALQRQGVIPKPRKLKTSIGRGRSSPKTSASKTRAKPRIEEPDAETAYRVPSAEDPPSSSEAIDLGYDEWAPLYTPKPAKVTRTVTVDNAGKQTVSENLEESFVPFQAMVQKQKFAAQQAQSNNDLARHVYDRYTDHVHQLNEMDYDMDRARQQIDAQTRWRNMEAQEHRFNTRAQQQMQQNQFDHSRATMKDQYQHEETINQQQWDGQTTMKGMELDGMKYARRMDYADNQGQRAHAERMQANQNRHTEEMVKLNNIGTFVKAHNEAADGAHKRRMDGKQYLDKKQKEAYQFVNTVQATAAERKMLQLIDIFTKFGLNPDDIDDLMHVRQKEVRLIEMTADPTYLHSILFTGVDQISIYDPFNPWVKFMNSGKYKLKYHGINGYSYRGERITAYTWLVHVYKSTPEAVKFAYGANYRDYLLSCGNRCDIA